MNNSAPTSTMGKLVSSPIDRALPTYTALEHRVATPSSVIVGLNNESAWMHHASPVKKKTKHHLRADHTRKTVHWAADSRWNCQEANNRSPHAPSKPVRTFDAPHEVDCQAEATSEEYEPQLNDQPQRVRSLTEVASSCTKKHVILLDDLSGMLAAVSSSESENDGDCNDEEDSDNSGETTAPTPKSCNMCHSRRDAIAGHNKSTSPSKVVLHVDAHPIPPSLIVPNPDSFHVDQVMMLSPRLVKKRPLLISPDNIMQ